MVHFQNWEISAIDHYYFILSQIGVKVKLQMVFGWSTSKIVWDTKIAAITKSRKFIKWQEKKNQLKLEV